MSVSPVLNRVMSRTSEAVYFSDGTNLDTLENGIHLDFANDFHYTKVAGQSANVAPLTSLFTFTSGNQSMYMGPAGLLIASATNTPRIEYDANGNCLGLLMEASKTNLALNSRDLSAGTWTKSNLSGSTATSATSIDGNARNIRLIEDTATGVHGVIAGITITANTTYCLSAIVKSAGRNFAFLYGINTDQFGALFDFANLTSTSFVAGTSTVNQHGIRSLGNGYFLIWVSGILNAASTTLNFVGGPATSTTVPSGYSYTGNGVSGIDMEYIQIELGSFPSSRIPTTGTAVTRTADSCIRTPGSEFNATAGTVVVAGRSSGGRAAAEDQYVYQIDDVTFTERYRLVRFINTDIARFQVSDGGVSQAALDATFANSTAFKHAAAWAANDFAASFNGAAVLTDAAGTLPTVTTLNLGVSPAGLSQMNGHILTFDYYPKRENNGFLQRASTL